MKSVIIREVQFLLFWCTWIISYNHPTCTNKQEYEKAQLSVMHMTCLKDDDSFICIYIGHTLLLMIDVMFPNMEI